MRFRKGSKVEVLSKKEVPSGSWRSAEIISGSAHFYTVRYDKFEGGSSNQTVVERVSRKAIRPCPTSLQEVFENWIPGDVVEVFLARSWKIATVSEVSGKNNYLVRLLGSSSEFRVSKFDIRARRSWQDCNLGLRNKKSGNEGDDSKEDENESHRNYGLSSQIQKPQNSPNLKTWRRKSNYEYSQVKFGGASLARTNIFEERFELNDADRATCSVCSCSGSNTDDRGLPCRRVSSGCNEDTDGSTSDAESFCHSGYGTANFLLSRDDDDDEPLEAEIHMLELHAYRCTIEALYASGPLSWDKELLLTDLRLSLHISNDEHLMEIKNLVSRSISSR